MTATGMLIYLHGFNSSPQSHKAQVLGRYMEERGLSARYACPALPTLASEAVEEIEKLPMRDACFVGSSLGGFYATHLAEKHSARAVLINPAVNPHVGLRAYLGPQRNLHTGKLYDLTDAHLEEWRKLYVPALTPARYLLIVESGDEVLDYRAAVARYAGTEQHIVNGGDHSLRSFPEQLPRILRFAGLAA